MCQNLKKKNLTGFLKQLLAGLKQFHKFISHTVINMKNLLQNLAGWITDAAVEYDPLN